MRGELRAIEVALDGLRISTRPVAEVVTGRDGLIAVEVLQDLGLRQLW